MLDATSDKVPEFISKKGIEVCDQSGETCNTKKQIRFKTSMLRSDLCDYNDAYIVVKAIVTVSANAGVNNIRDKKNRPLAFKNNTPFVSSISKINGVLIENADNLDIVMPMYNLLE